MLLTLHVHILISYKDKPGILNSVQEFKRDISVAYIRAGSEELDREEDKFRKTDRDGRRA
ncbi:hypothetical protein OG21DRAFT_1516289 [Imleria badia]|nr:hypothetical protein OG21DRAFT_1516289 [Imleria badia]